MNKGLLAVSAVAEVVLPKLDVEGSSPFARCRKRLPCNDLRVTLRDGQVLEERPVGQSGFCIRVVFVEACSGSCSHAG